MATKKRERIKAKFGGRCAYCGCELGDRWHVDHVEPVFRQLGSEVRNGRFVPTGTVFRPENERDDNLFPSCAPCNIDKGASSLEGWRDKLERSCDVLRARSPTYKHGVRFGLIVENRKPVTFYFETLDNKEAATMADVELLPLPAIDQEDRND